MIKHNNRYLSAVKQRSKRIKTALELKNPDSSFTPNENLTNQMSQVKISGNGSFLGTAMKKAEIIFYGVDYSNLQGKTVKLTLEAEEEVSQQFEKISLGVYTIHEIKTDYEKLETKITMYDIMGKFAEEDFNQTPVDFPTTVAGLVHNIATNNGLTVDVLTLNSLPNVEASIDQNLWLKIKNTTTRNVLDEIAKATASTIVVRDEELVFKKHTPVGDEYKLTKDNLRTFKIGAEYGFINSVVLSREPVEDNIAHRHASADRPETTFDIKIVNNEILDKRRVDTIVPIYNALVGSSPFIKTNDIECKTEGHAFYEVGDYVPFDLENKVGVGFLTEYTLDIKSGIEESLKFKNPSIAKTNYQTAGSIIKTVWNTEIETDKQKQRITAVVEKTESLEQSTRTEFARLEQNIDRFKFQIQKSGSLNLIKNSAFWSWENDLPNFWEVQSAPHAQSSAEAKFNGSISARTIYLERNHISQTVPIVLNEHYSFSCLVKKGVIGNLIVNIYQNGEITHTETIPHGRAEIYKKITFENIIGTGNEIKVEIKSDNIEGAYVSDIMFSNSETVSNWTMAQGEIANSNVVIDEKGVLVKSSLYDGDYTVISPLEFSGYSKIGNQTVKVFSLNKDITEVKKLKAEDELNMNPIKIVAIKDGDTTGWAFVKSGGN